MAPDPATMTRSAANVQRYCPSGQCVHQRFTVSVATLVTSARFAEIVTVVLFDAGRVVETVNVVLVAPAGTVMLLGTVAILG